MNGWAMGDTITGRTMFQHTTAPNPKYSIKKGTKKTESNNIFISSSNTTRSTEFPLI